MQKITKKVVSGSLALIIFSIAFAASDLVGRLTDRDGRIRVAALQDLKRCADKEKRAMVPQLVAIFQKNDSRALDAAVALGRLRSNAAAAVPDLITGLKADTGRKVSYRNLEIISDALVSIGAPSIDPLSELLDCNNASLATAAADALQRIGGEKAEEALSHFEACGDAE